MNDIIKSYQERFRRNRHTFRRYAAFLLALAMITTLFVNWQLHGVGISMTADYQCGEQEHTHTADCYTKMLVCGYNEGELENPEAAAAAPSTDTSADDSGIALYSAEPVIPEPQIEWVPHEHTDDCYTEVQTLTCLEEEHVHDDDCFDPEDGSLICDKFEHTHDESCYTTEYELTCGLEEGALVEQVVEPTQSAALFEMAAAAPVAVALPVDTGEELVYHHHTDACYEEVLTCPFPEHHHTVNCLSNTLADLEPASAPDVTLEGFWSQDLIDVAMTQLGYEQSEKNFKLDTEDHATVRHYTRYGQAYGNPYGEWDVMFLSYCLYYAEIPESVVPRESSVLALRNAMKGMDWLLDGADGTAAAPGDIVIYQKDATYTVAVEPEEDTTTSDDLADLYHENSVDTQSSDPYGIATLPAIVDETTKPVVVDDDFSVPSISLPASEPQTTTVTSRVDTVGIVTDIDEEAGTLTVISGDVDGKVDYVTLAMSEVTGVVSLASAEMDYDTLDAQTLAESWIKKITFTVDGSTTTIKDDYNYNKDLDLTVKDSKGTTLHYEFTIPATSSLPAGTKELTYQLPAGLEIETDASAILYNSQGDAIGTIHLSTNGTVRLVFNNDLNGHQTTGHFNVTCKVDKDSTQDKDAIKFPGDGTTIKIEGKTDLTLKKEKPEKTGHTADGRYIVHYKVTASSKYGSGEPINLSDFLQKNDSFANASYENITLKKVDTKNGNVKSLIRGTDYEVVEIASSSGVSGVTDGSTGIRITDANGDALPALGEHDSYVLEYDVYVDHVGPGDSTLTNLAFANGKKDPQDLWFEDEFTKSGSYDPKTGLITWTVTIKPNGASLKGYTLKDTLKDGQTMSDFFEIRDSNNQVYDTSSVHFTGQTSFSYTFGEQFDGNSAYSYTITYKTKPKAGFDIGDSASNKASLELGNKTKWSDSGTASYNDRSKSSSKKALDSTELDGNTKDANNIFKLRWSLSVTVPAKWTDNKLEIKDKINAPTVSTGSNTNNDHYSILKDLDAEIKQNLVLTRENDGGKITYDNLDANGLELKITYYSGRDCSGTEVTADDAHVGSFKLQFIKKDSFSPIQTIEITQYTTLGDASGVQEGQTITFKNESDGSSAEYHYTIPATKTKQLIKMASDTAPKGNSGQKINVGGNYKANETTVTSGNGEDGSTYIYYQLKLVLDGTKLGDSATITDKLPDYVSYVNGSAVLMYCMGDTDYDWWSDHSDIYSSTSGYENNVALTSDRFFDCALDDTTNTLTFHLKSELNGITNSVYAFLIRYAVKVDDTFWDPTLESQTHVFTNSAYWEGVGPSKTYTEVKHSARLLDKSGSYDSTSNIVTYTVIINPDRLKLGDDEMITLKDTLKLTKGNLNKAQLVDGSVKLYSYDAATGQRGAEIPSGAYNVDYTEGTNSGGDQNLYTLTVQVPNGRSYLLEYKYKNISNTHYTMKNTAELNSYVIKDYPTEVTKNAVSGGADTTGMTVHKVDSQNISLSLPNATFQLEYFDAASGTYQKYADTFKTDANGHFYISFSDSGSGATGDGAPLYPYNRLYRLTEAEAPQGYNTDASWVHYFIWMSNGADKTTAYNTAVGSYTGNTSVTGIEQNAINYYTHDASVLLTVTNVSNRLTVQKVWYDKNNQSIDSSSDTLPESIIVKLYRATSKGAVGEYVTDLTLYKNEGWSAAYEIPTGYTDYYYYVQEPSTGSIYEPSYTNNYVQGSGTIVVTNTEKDTPGYELPSTGGAGTTPFTAVGGTMMLAAVVYGVRRKRRSERRAED